MNSTYVVGVCALILAAIFHMQADGLPSVARQLPIPLIWIVSVLAVLMMLEEFIKQRRLNREARASDDTQVDANTLTIVDDVITQTSLEKAATQTAEDSGVPVADTEAPLDPINWKVFVSFSLTLFAYIWLIPVLGYIITTVTFIVGVLVFSRTIQPWSAILIAVGFTAFVWVVFVWALGLPVPLLPWLD